MNDLIALSWPGYGLLDSGNGLRLERFAGHTVVRPDTNILWDPSDPDNAAWTSPDLRFDGQSKERWFGDAKLIEEGWLLPYKEAKFRVRPTPFRHMGLFPEQAPQWDLACRKVRESGGKPRVLNLFAYTGAASVLLAQAGASVCHVDASKGSVMWAKENARLSGLPEDAIRWIVDDVPKFLKREARRGSRYDLILMDPPVFGRGPQGEIWRLEEQLAGLAGLAGELLSEEPLGFFLNFYATALYPESVLRVAEQALAGRPLSLAVSPVGIRETMSGKVLQTGFCLAS
jgi:23S rRNA (cytosine1962-C5)-methyltransferase